MKRSRIRPVSAKRQAENRQRQKLRTVLLAERGPWCQAPAITLHASCWGKPELPEVGYVAHQAINSLCTGQWVDMHEVLTRARGGSITDPANILLLCRPCHDWVTTHPREAHAVGLVKNSWEAA